MDEKELELELTDQDAYLDELFVKVRCDSISCYWFTKYHCNKEDITLMESEDKGILTCENYENKESFKT